MDDEALRDPVMSLLDAQNLMARYEYDKAITILQNLVAEDPRDSTVLTALGIAYTEAGQNEKAVKALEWALALDNTIPEAHEALGCALYRLDRYG
ncbi:MAG: tetratricopeptide repeat protein, partial [Treponemataceae bacterium]|nr:tetratricopeptide repeat protein [Treponemataceae bacterium]